MNTKNGYLFQRMAKEDAQVGTPIYECVLAIYEHKKVRKKQKDV